MRLEDDVQNPETTDSQRALSATGVLGALIAASAAVDAFNEADIVAGRVLAANMEAALAAVERDKQPETVSRSCRRKTTVWSSSQHRQPRPSQPSSRICRRER
ncbi:hypothetical protein C9J85_12095 [Haloferax sp. wsp5]|nr:hypothetical protein C9J85_12095 [Haloferax sp. wsp5]